MLIIHILFTYPAQYSNEVDADRPRLKHEIPRIIGSDASIMQYNCSIMIVTNEI